MILMFLFRKDSNQQFSQVILLLYIKHVDEWMVTPTKLKTGQEIALFFWLV